MEQSSYDLWEVDVVKKLLRKYDYKVAFGEQPGEWKLYHAEPGDRELWLEFTGLPHGI